MTRHPGGRPLIRGAPQTIRKQLKLTEAEWAELRDAIPDDEPEGPWIIEAALRRARADHDPVQRLTRAEILARADAVALDLLGATRRDAFLRLKRGELSGTLAEPELRMLYDMLQRGGG